MTIEKEKLDELYKNTLHKGEELVWTSTVSTSKIIFEKNLYVFGVGIITGLFTILILLENSILKLELIPIILGSIIVSMLITNVILSYTFSKGTIYSITNKRYLIHNINKENNIKQKLSMRLSNIKKIHKASYSFKRTTKSNIILTHKLYTGNNFDEYKLPVIKGVIITNDDFKKIENAWFENTIKAQINSLFKTVADKYDMNMIPFHYKLSDKLILNGNISGMESEIILSSNYRISSLNVKIKCPNHQYNSLKIFKEGDSSKVRKILGMQDLKVSNSYLDNKYIFQSNDEYFFNSVINKECQEKLHAYGLENITIDFGKNEKKSKPKPDHPNLSDVLDAHLIDENKNKNIINEDNYSILEYDYFGFGYYDSINIRLIEKTVKSLEAIFQIALNIQKYNEK